VPYAVPALPAERCMGKTVGRFAAHRACRGKYEINEAGDYI